MKILFAGDSITEGITGDSYLKLVQKEMPDLKAVNLGLGGDTMLGITSRLMKYLSKRAAADLDALIIQAGHNDIILPSLEERSPSFRAFSALLEKRGSVPTEKSLRFRALYIERLREIRKLFSGPCAVMTLGCINEDPESETDTQRRTYNDEIRIAAQELGLELIDIGKEFDAVLSGGGKYYRTASVRDVLLDGLISRLPNGTMRISEMRNLQLTIDGVHLNSRGAEIYAGLITETIKKFERSFID